MNSVKRRIDRALPSSRLTCRTPRALIDLDWLTNLSRVGSNTQREARLQTQQTKESKE